MPYGEIPEWPKGADCKSAGSAFVGSNPTLTTIIFCEIFLARYNKAMKCAGIAQLVERQPSKL
jgi:hypothetical protein